ncbi:hypothetical protein NB231_14543 [Nitrococcus mobilis Nb-231]|uniref:CRISPR-associated protein, VVA1548 family n=1 Tax=Nitrococcus mobilis Nb-231 TaxID=314278 RepID=A4BL59_9GAMM|nr:CRISPR-associated protein Csx16 [Nitrococcus mobilis]EAR23047.1 hypothetical protein NB231_14543 [Nitrococcus mobilis Nb-231]
MTLWLVTRHAGALEWLARRGLQGGRIVPHLDPAWIQAGDRVVGTLPVQLVAAVCARGARYEHLSVMLPAELRGRELSADTLERHGARLEPYYAERIAAVRR